MGKKIAFLSILIGAFGVLMVYSASQVWAEYKQGSEFYFLLRQLIFYLLGIVVFLFFSKIKPIYYYKYAKHIFIAAVILLILVLIPGIGIVRGGARSWIGIASFSIQPSELSKIAIIIITAKYLSTNYGKTVEIKYLIPPLLILALVFGLIMLEPDFGTGAIIVATILSMLMISGIKRQYYYLGILGGIAAVVILILSAPYRLDRIFAYLDPFSDPLGGGFQIIQSLYAIVPAGLFGMGLFNSKQKYFYLPEPQTDFIFAVIFEEVGLIGASILLLFYFFIFYLGIKIALKQINEFNKFLSIGIVISMFIQFFINIAVVTGIIPVTGVTLPFLSYGGSSLILNYMMVGILVSIDKSEDENRNH